jgi:quercetin dioxygenase-like cupin family protein
MNGLRFFFVAMVVGVVIWLAPSSDLTVRAQQPAAPSTPGARRTVLDRHDLSVPGREGVLVKTELDPGAKEPRHTHPGDIFGYVLEGTITLVADGQPTRTAKAGEVFFVPAGQIHSGQNNGTTPVKLLVSFFVEKGKPLTTPVE